MKIQIGKYYRTRHGRIVVAIRFQDNVYDTLVIIETIDTKYRTSVLLNGRYCYNDEDSAWDLMEEVTIIPQSKLDATKDYVFAYDIAKIGKSICFSLNDVNFDGLKTSDVLKVFALKNGGEVCLFSGQNATSLHRPGHVLFMINISTLCKPYILDNIIEQDIDETIDKIHEMLKEVSDILKSKRK